ncbi:MAG: hypothetical protein KBT45_04275 [Bacteroidales bacterium]|nr:hypothetical protein [Candidatus Colimorpha pelethequi]MCQ2261605.1 hypothetical protein [Bacteroidales bacterium]
MEDKKQYIKPTVKCVVFKAELGFAMSQGFSSYNSSKEDYDFEEDAHNVNGNHFGGFFTNNTDDWD